MIHVKVDEAGKLASSARPSITGIAEKIAVKEFARATDEIHARTV